MSDAGEQFKVALEKAGEVVECSYVIGAAKDNETGTIRPVAIFYDSDGGHFHHAFSFKSNDRVMDFCNSLSQVSNQILRKGSGNGLVLP